MKRVIFSFLTIFCCTEVGAQVVITSPDSITQYNNLLRESIVKDSGNLENSRTNKITKKTGKKTIPNNGKITVIFDPLDSTKNTLILKTLPR
jgi:hypothetical protein